MTGSDFVELVVMLQRTGKVVQQVYLPVVLYDQLFNNIQMPPPNKGIFRYFNVTVKMTMGRAMSIYFKD